MKIALHWRFALKRLYGLWINSQLKEKKNRIRALLWVFLFANFFRFSYLLRKIKFCIWIIQIDRVDRLLLMTRSHVAVYVWLLFGLSLAVRTLVAGFAVAFVLHMTWQVRRSHVWFAADITGVFFVRRWIMCFVGVFKFRSISLITMVRGSNSRHYHSRGTPETWKTIMKRSISTLINRLCFGFIEQSERHYN